MARRGPGRPLRWMAAQRQNPAYRPAKERPRSGGAFLLAKHYVRAAALITVGRRSDPQQAKAASIPPTPMAVPSAQAATVSPVGVESS